jgi:uncharacterized protein (DUF1786 family)
MQILTVDVGTGTQDILLFDSDRTPENCLKLVVPSPTLLLSKQVAAATALRAPLVITGNIMGGGPVSWAVENHHRAGLPIFSTEDAARTFNDDLDAVRADLGIEFVDDAEAEKLAKREGYVNARFGDFDYYAIRAAFAAFGVHLQPDGFALAVFDHGAAPPHISDRQFRMDYLAERLARGQPLSALAFPAARVPADMTRLAALAATAEAAADAPVIVMDTAPAAVLGALEDPRVAEQPGPVVVNVGNFHTLAFQFAGGRFVRLFEHHTGELTQAQLVEWLRRLADGTIRHDAVFADKGHGALTLDETPQQLEHVAVVGPRRAFLRDAGLPAYFAVPHGDQMLAGCFGLLRACADVVAEWREPIERGLAGSTDKSLW